LEKSYRIVKDSVQREVYEVDRLGQSVAPRPTVLIVDDDIGVLGALARLLRAEGFHARAFESPRRLLASEIPRTGACLLSDLFMPEMNGVELSGALAASGRCLPLIIMTGRNDAQSRQLLHGVDAIAVLFKPFDPELVRDAIDRAFALTPPSA